LAPLATPAYFNNVKINGLSINVWFINSVDHVLMQYMEHENLYTMFWMEISNESLYTMLDVTGSSWNFKPSKQESDHWGTKTSCWELITSSCVSNLVIGLR
jgi:hypothetical protein